MVDPRVTALFDKHGRESRALFADFVDAHPTLEFGTNHDNWTPEQDAEWRVFCAPQDAAHQAEREALAAELDAEL